MKRLLVIIVNYRTAKLTLECLRSLIGTRTSFAELRVIIVDGASCDGSAEILHESISDESLQGWTELLALTINGGFAFANNRALMLEASRGKLPDYIALINPDARATSGAVEALAALLDRLPQAGAVGAQLIHEDGRLQGSAFRFPNLLAEFCGATRTGIINRFFQQPEPIISASQACQVPWVTGAAVMFRTTALESVGLFDEGFFLYFEETELMWRLNKAGWQIWHEPGAKIVHHGGAATQIRDTETGNMKKKRVPSYWYQSRRRYFTLVGGRVYAFASALAWLGGHMVWLIRCALTGRSDDGALFPATDLITFGFCYPIEIPSAAAPLFTTPPAPTPAWMNSVSSQEGPIE